MILTLEQIKAHLNIDADYSGDDLLLLDYCTVAEDAVIKHLDIVSFDDIAKAGVIPASVIHCVLLMIGNQIGRAHV